MENDKGIQEIYQKAINKSEKLNKIVKESFKDMLRKSPKNLVFLLKEALDEVDKEKQ